MAVILNKTKSSAGNPYAYYKVESTSVSNRTIDSVKVNLKVTSNLASSQSFLGTGQSMGLKAYFTLNGKDYGPLTLKSTSSGWSGTGTHTASASYVVTGLSVLQTSMKVKFRVTRTGTAEGDYSESCALSSTSCSDIKFEQAHAQSVFNSISQNVATNSTFSIDATQYSLYDVLTLYNGDPNNGGTLIKTIKDIKSGVAYQFSDSEQNVLNALFRASTTSVNLTARLTTFIDSTEETNLGFTDKNMLIVLPQYVPTATLSNYTATDNYNAYKNNPNDVIKGISKVGITLVMSNNYNNAYDTAICNGINGTIAGKIIEFKEIPQSDTYNIVVKDSRGISSSIKIDGSSYTSPIKTIQYTVGNVKAQITRTTPTGTTADVEVELLTYDGNNFATEKLLADNFIFTYQEKGGTVQIKSLNDFTLNNGKYICQLTSLNYKKEIIWSITGTDKIGNTLNGNNGDVPIGLPVYNAFIDDGKNYMVINGKLALMTSTDSYILLEPITVDEW